MGNITQAGYLYPGWITLPRLAKYKNTYTYKAYNKVSEKGWNLGARRHKVNYNFFSIGDPLKIYGIEAYNKFS